MNKVMTIAGALAVIGGGAMVGMSLTGGGGSTEPGNLRLQIETKPAVMSASYKVHANKELKDGRYWVAKLLLTNEGPGPVDDVRVAYRIPNVTDWTTPQPYPQVLPEQTVVDLFYPRLPSSLAEKLTTSTEQIEIKITYDAGEDEREELRKVDFDLRGRNDLIYTTMDSDEIANLTDVYENTDLLASFVTPEDPVIKYFTQQLQQKVLGGSTAGVSNSQEEVVRFMEGLYNYQLAAGVVYGGTLGLPEKIGNSYSVVQKVRMPREVLTGEAGLCVELSTLFASVALSAGLEPVIFLTARHAFPGIKLGDGSILPIEATTIGGEGIGGRGDFKAAIEAGVKNANAFYAGGSDGIGASIGLLDISALHAAGIRPPELPDDSGLRKDIDDTLTALLAGAKSSGGSSGGSKKKTRTASNTGGGSSSGGGSSGGGRSSGGGGRSGGSGAPGGFQRYQHPTGSFSLAHPAGWTPQNNPFPQFPQLAAVVAQNPGGLGPAV
ncbi:MAG: hypothetical protein AAFZ58_09940, partial [Pseudomonadota bacterium]